MSFPYPSNSFSSRTNSDAPLFIFIMAGGSGERFWPASRKATPKHLLRLLGKETLLEQTVQRFEGLIPREQIFVLTNEAQYEATCQALSHHPRHNIIAEPAKRDTAPAATLATALALRHHPNALIGLFPADAMIHNHLLFRQHVTDAATMAAKSNALITFSIPPTHPSISFGYLDLDEASSTIAQTTFRPVRHFVEKPPLSKAQEFFASGHHGWNAGIFLWRAQLFLEECRRQQPILARFLEELVNTTTPKEIITQQFPTLPKISVDYAIMENAKQVMAALATFDWDDVGHWTALPKHLGCDTSGNTTKVTTSEVILHDAKNNIVLSQETSRKTIALCGVENLVVVQTDDALLICHRDAVEKIKQLPLPEKLK